MFWKVFWGIWVILAVLCMGFFMYYLATLPEATFLLTESKALNETEVACSFTPREAVVVWKRLGNDGKPITKSFNTPISGLLNVIDSVEIQKSKEGGREVYMKFRPFRLALYFFWGTLFVSTAAGLRYIFKTLR